MLNYFVSKKRKLTCRDTPSNRTHKRPAEYPHLPSPLPDADQHRTSIVSWHFPNNAAPLRPAFVPCAFYGAQLLCPPVRALGWVQI